MPLLFWYLPFMIVSGALVYGQDNTRSFEAGKAQDLGNAGRSLLHLF